MDNNMLIRDLVSKYDTPLFVYDLTVVHERIRDLASHLHAAIQLFYSLKANPNATLVHEIHKSGVQLEVCSPYEYRTAIRCGVKPGEMMYLGPGKRTEDIVEALDGGVGYFIVESLDELDVVNEWSAATGKQVGIGLRVNPSQTIQGSKLKMGGISRQFGIDEDVLDKAVERAQCTGRVHIYGLHVYYGTRILDADVIISNTESVLDIAGRFMRKYGIRLQYLGIGGGMGVPYFAAEQKLDSRKLVAGINERVSRFIASFGPIKFMMESGRFLVAEAGDYIAKVVSTKTSKGTHYIILDGGTHHFAAGGGTGSLLKKNFPIDALVDERREMAPQMLAGPLCTPEDLLGRQVEMPLLQKGDLVRIRRTGAYGLTASPVLFLSHRLPREILVWGDQYRLVRDHDEYLFPQVKPIHRP